jgi:hypothetical protein
METAEKTPMGDAPLMPADDSPLAELLTEVGAVEPPPAE